VSEIAGLNIANVKCEGKRPHIYVPKEIAKRNKPRKVPLWWDGSTLAELAAWKAERLNLGGKSDSSFVCAQSKAVQGKRLSIRNVQFRWQAAIKVLGKERADNLSIHSGRHSFCSHAIAGGRTVVEVQNAAGHAGLNTLTIYAHLVEDDDEAVGNLFDFAAK
jgi:site-specific recombinase XerC